MAEATEGKRVAICEKEYEVDEQGTPTGAFTFTFSDGEVVAGNIADFPVNIQKFLPVHGIMQKGGDSYASVKGNVAEAKSNLKDVLDNLKNGLWRAGRGEGESRPRLGELAEAIARIKQVEVAKALEAVTKATDDQRKTWRSNAKVKSVIAQIRAEAAAKALEAAAEEELQVEIPA